MLAMSAIGLDIAKSVFQVHGIGAEGKGVVRRKLKRRYVLAFFEKLLPYLVGIEACATSHYGGAWTSGAADAAGLCEPVRQAAEKHATHAEAICEAVTRPNMRFVEIKTVEQQSCLVLHRTR